MHRLLFLQALIEPLIRVKMLSPLALRTRKPLSPCLALGKRARANLRVVCQSTRPRGDPAPPQAAATVVVEPLSASAGEEEDAVTCIANGVDGVTCFLDNDVDTPEHLPVRASAHQHAPHGVLGALLLISPFAFWGTSMTVMKGLLTTASVPPLLMGAFRLLPAGAMLVAWAAANGRPQPKTTAAWVWIAAFALIDGAAFQGCLAEGLQRTPAGLGSVIIDSQPLTVAVLAALLFGESLSLSGVLGLALGVAGLLLLEVPEQYIREMAGQLVGASSTADMAQLVPDASTLQGYAQEAAALLTHPAAWLDSGEVWMLMAAQAMAVGTVMVRYVTKHADAVTATGWHMIIGGAMLVGAALAADPDAFSSISGHTGPQEWVGAAYVSLLGGAASYGIFFWQASVQGNLTALSSLTFLTPVFAAASGYVALGETFTVPQLVGAAVTLGSVALINSSRPSAAPATRSRSGSMSSVEGVSPSVANVEVQRPAGGSNKQQ